MRTPSSAGSRGVELVESRRVHVPQLGISVSSEPKRWVRKCSSGAGEGQHVGAEIHLHPEILRVLPRRVRRRRAARSPVAVVVALGVNRPTGRIVERGELDEAGERHRVVPVGQRMPDELVEIVVGPGKGVLVDVGRFRQEHIRERLRGMRVVGARLPLGRVGLHSHGSHVDHAERQLGHVISSPRCSETDRPARICAARS